jgi:1,5-anhydro-D-fructose reductase (1,5-anhydro-D-mannitol-forming)
MQRVRWGIVGCGDVTEVKSGPAFHKAQGSSLVAVMRRDAARAESYAKRHRVPRWYADARALIDDPEVDAVYIATPPSSHLQLALQVAASGKPCLVEKPMAMSHAECVRMEDAFASRGVPLWVAYYRRALPRFLKVRELLAQQAIGSVTSVHVQITDRLASGDVLSNWRFAPAIAGAGLLFDLASHCVDLLDFLIGPVREARGCSVNSGGAYAAEDVTAVAFAIDDDVVGTGIWNFNADEKTDAIVFTGSRGRLTAPVFTDGDVVLEADGPARAFAIRNPPHVHQPLIQSIVDELHGRGHCESTGASGARASWVLDRCLNRC